MDFNKKYIIDLSQAQTPSDIVFELSTIIEKDEASNKKIWLKLGEVTLNQSQLLSINSLISSINSTLDLIESESPQTELAAATLGINTKNIEEEMQEEMEAFEAQKDDEVEVEPSEQYIQMSDHIEEEQVEETPAQDVECEAVIESQEEAVAEEESSEDSPEQIEEVEEQAETIETPDSTEEEDAAKIEQNEEIQEHLDSIFDSETKLENILSDDKDIIELKNCPLTVDISELDINDEVMTDEDYEILQMNTQYHKQTVRSGQVIKSNGNVVIIGDCHPGCEIHAAGDITVWGILGGIAHAGSAGNTKARIRALNLNAIQLRIAESYARRPDHIKNIYIEKTNTFTPEEARNINGSIVILKVNEK